MRTNFSQKRRPVYLDKNNQVCFSKSFICKSILELMNSNNTKLTDSKKIINMTRKDIKFFNPADLYQDLSEYFIAFYNKKPDRNTFYYCISLLERSKKLERIKIKKRLYYKLITLQL